MKLKENLVYCILGALVFLNVLAGIVALDLSRVRLLEVNFFDVGQGDSIFIETPQRQQILIDGGPSSVIVEKLAREMPFWDRTIDLAILTHPERDHLSGLLEVLKRYRVENILWTGVVRNTQEFKEWERLIHKEGANVRIGQRGQKITASGVTLNILFPFENLEGQEIKNSNNTSIVAQLVFNNSSFLFTGDIQKSAEKELLESGLDSDVIKIAHHGSKNSNSKEFIGKVLPEIAVISSAEGNSYGHPHQEVLDILSNYDIRVLRTDQNGDIKIISDGENIKYEISNI